MNLIFTLCSNNYLAQAKTLADSLLKFHNDYLFVIGLIDKKIDTLDYSLNSKNIEVIEVSEIGIPGFSEMVEKYNIIELNTAVKPFYFLYLIKKYKEINFFFYFDPDIKIYKELYSLEKLLIENDIIITPHIFTPIPLDSLFPPEYLFLNYGLYNLGFIGIKKSSNTLNFLTWWSSRTYNYGFDRVRDGLFVDQLWINFAPLFFEKVFISKNYTLNVGPWNLHERFISYQNEVPYVNGEKLTFYHFSSYNPEKPELMSRHYTRYTFETRAELIPLYDTYKKELFNNNYTALRQIPCAYIKQTKNAEVKTSKLDLLKRALRKILNKVKYYK